MMKIVTCPFSPGRDKLVVVGFGDNVAAFYTSNLFVAAPYDISGLMSMMQPIFIVAMVTTAKASLISNKFFVLSIL